MAAGIFHLDRDGIARILKGAGMRRALHTFADPMASDVAASTGMPVETGDRTTDRAVVDVTIAHAGGIGQQIQHGALTRAATAQGLEVRPE